MSPGIAAHGQETGGNRSVVPSPSRRRAGSAPEFGSLARAADAETEFACGFAYLIPREARQETVDLSHRGYGFAGRR